jgi:uncharacterized lipoprotein YbaY
VTVRRSFAIALGIGWVGSAWAACSAAAPAGPQPGSPPAAAVAGRRPDAPWPKVEIRIEPPLPASAQLTVDCESGHRWAGTVPGTGTRLALPPGPASFVLEFGNRRVEASARVAEEHAEVVLLVAGG